jgi:hypothetical protein
MEEASWGHLLVRESGQHGDDTTEPLRLGRRFEAKPDLVRQFDLNAMTPNETRSASPFWDADRYEEVSMVR